MLRHSHHGDSLLHLIKHIQHFFLNILYRSSLCNKLISSFLSHLPFNWRTFSRRVTACWWRQSAKIQVWTNQNSRNNWYQIITRTVYVSSKKPDSVDIIIMRVCSYVLVFRIAFLDVEYWRNTSRKIGFTTS